MNDYQPTRFSNELVARLRGQIARYDINQDDLARLCDVSQSQFSKIIRGVRPMTLDQFAALCVALDIEAGRLTREVESFLGERSASLASPVRWVEGAERLPAATPFPREDLDAWARAALDRLWDVSVGTSPRDEGDPTEIDLSREAHALAASTDDSVVDPDRTP